MGIGVPVIRVSRVPPSKYSTARNGISASSPMSKIWITFGCWIWATVSASARNRDSSSGEANAWPSSTLMATTRFSFTWVAR